MRVPILKLHENLIAVVQDALTDADLVTLQSDLAKQIGQHNIRGVAIDVTALDVMDSFATRTLRNIAYTTQLRGAEMIIVGIQPDVAFAMVQLGLRLDNVSVALDLERGIDYLEHQVKVQGELT